MEKPQEYLSNKELVDDSYKLKNDIETVRNYFPIEDNHQMYNPLF